MAKALAGLGVRLQIAVGLATPVGAYLICTRKAPWIVLVVLGLLALNAAANGVSLAREASRSRIDGVDTRYGVFQCMVAGLSMLSALMLVLSLG